MATLPPLNPYLQQMRRPTNALNPGSVVYEKPALSPPKGPSPQKASRSRSPAKLEDNGAVGGGNPHASPHTRTPGSGTNRGEQGGGEGPFPPSPSQGSLQSSVFNPGEMKPIVPSNITTLIHIILPPPHFQGAVNLDIGHIELRWLAKKPVTPPVKLLTLDNLRTDLFIDPNFQAGKQRQLQETVAINSPRSTITLMRNGVSVDMLQPKPFDLYRQEASLEHIPDYVLNQRYNHLETRRKNLLQRLIDEYHVHCQETPLEDVVEFCQAYDHVNPSLHSPQALETIWADAQARRRGEEGEGRGGGESFSPGAVGAEQVGGGTPPPNPKGLSHPLNGSVQRSASAPPPVSMAASTNPTDHTTATPTPTAISRAVHLPHQTANHPSSPSPSGGLRPRTHNLDMSPQSTPKASSQKQLSQTMSAAILPGVNARLTTTGSATVSTMNSALKVVQPSVTSFWASKIFESEQRIDKQAALELAARERMVQQRRVAAVESVERELTFGAKMADRRIHKEEMLKISASALRENAERHREMAKRNLEAIEEAKVRDVERRQANEHKREVAVAQIREQKRTIAAKHKETRQQKRKATEERQAELADAKLLYAEQNCNERMTKVAKAEQEKEEAHKKQRETFQARLAERKLAKERCDQAEIAKRELVEEDYQIMQARVEAFQRQKHIREANRKEWEAISAEKRAKVYNNAKGLQERHRQETLRKSARFQERWQKMQEKKQVEGEIAKEEQKLQAGDKRDYCTMRMAAFEFDKAHMVDTIQRKVDLVEKDAHARQSVLMAMKYEYEEKKRAKDRIVEEMIDFEIKDEKRAQHELHHQKKEQAELLRGAKAAHHKR